MKILPSAARPSEIRALFVRQPGSSISELADKFGVSWTAESIAADTGLRRDKGD